VIERDKVWTGPHNRRLGIDGPICLYDTTLRDGEQTVGVVLDPQQKLEIARALDDLGVDRIEAGFPRVSPDDAEAFRLIMAAGLRAEVWGFSRAVAADVDALIELGVSATVIESPVSDAKLAAYGLDRAEVERRVVAAVSHARAHDMRVAYFGVDGSRADLAFLERIYRAALEAGAEEIVVVDTIGAAAPETVEMLVLSAREWVGPDIPIHFHGHNDFGLATASAVAAVRAGAAWIQGTVNGMGERAGNANLVEVALALDALYGVSTNLHLDRAREVSELVRRLSGYELEPWKPVVGENLFVRESGAVASQFHDPPAIEPYSAGLVGAERRIVLGKKSGLDSVRIACEELGVDVPEEDYPKLLAAVKALAARERRLVTAEEFREMIAQEEAR
jgi:isopropylmalate/homocitrate/citramalate synthase